MQIFLTDIYSKTLPEDKLFMLSSRGKHNFDKYKNAKKRALQSAVGDLLIQKALKSVYAKNADEILIEQTPSGKPFVKGAPDFSVSHSENLVAIAIASEGECGAGLDIQLLKEPISPALIKGALSDVEKQRLELIENTPDKVKYFYRLFTEKESYVKFTGEGFTRFPRDVTDFSGAKFLTKYVFRQNELYCLTVCSQNITSLKITVIPFNDLFI